MQPDSHAALPLARLLVLDLGLSTSLVTVIAHAIREQVLLDRKVCIFR